MLKQDEISPLSTEQQVSIFYLLTSGHLDDVPIPNVEKFEAGWHEYAAANVPEVLRDIAEAGTLTDETRNKLDDAARAYRQTAEV